MNATHKLKNDHIMRVKNGNKHTHKLYTNQYINRRYTKFELPH